MKITSKYRLLYSPEVKISLRFARLERKYKERTDYYHIIQSEYNH